MFDKDQFVSDVRCCIVSAVWQGSHNDLLGLDCNHDEVILLNKKYKIIKGYIAEGTVLYYDLNVCATISVLQMFELLADDMTLYFVIKSSAGTTLITTLTGDFAGFTLTAFIDALVLQINTYTAYTATNASPNIVICFEGNNSIDLADATISIEIADFYFLKWRENNSRRVASTTLGYGPITAGRPTYVGAVQKLYVPNGDRIDYIFPSTVAGVPLTPPCNFPPAGATISSITKSFTGGIGGGLGVGTRYTTTIAPFLTTNFFQAGQQFEFFATVTDVGLRTLGGVLTSPVSDYANLYRLRFVIVSYVAATGVLTYDMVQWTWQGNPFTTAFPATTAGQAGGAYNPAIPAFGTQGGTAIGNRIWSFDPSQLGWGTMSIYSCDLVSGDLTFVKDLEINVHGSTESSLNKTTDQVFVSGFGADLNYSGVVQVNPSTDTQSGVVRIGTTSPIAVSGNLGLRWNPVTGNNYAFSGATLSKIGSTLQYNSLANKSINAGSITFDSLGGIYIASLRTTPLVVYWIPDPAANPLTIDPAPILKFTALDNTIGAPIPNPFPYNYNSPAISPGITYPALAPLFINAGLDVYGLIWVAGATFILTYTDPTSPPVGGTKYSLNCVVVSYDNTTGELRYTISTITTTILGTVTPIASFPLTGNRNWTWEVYPSFLGGIACEFHSATKRLFVTRATNVGGVLQSYDMYASDGATLLTEAEILATRVNYFPPGSPTTILSGNINYQEIEDKFFMPSTNGQNIYVFDPNTTSWETRPIRHTPPPTIGGDGSTTGGVQLMSYTADESLRNSGGGGINMYGDSSGTEVGVIDYEPINEDQFTGSFNGESEAVVRQASDNCHDLEDIEKGAEEIRLYCGCPDCAADITDISAPPSDGYVTVKDVYYGRSALTTLTNTQVQALTVIQKPNFAGTYAFAADSTNGYCYVSFPSNWGVPVSVINPLNGFPIALNTVFNVTISGVQYSVYRSFYELFGSISFQFNQ